LKRRALLAALVSSTLLPAVEATAQRAEHFEARLAPTPRDAAMRATIAGSGAVEATLDGRALTVSGTFQGLKSPAIRARIHSGRATAVRGPVVASLDLARDPAGTAGTMAGVVELDDEMFTALAAGRLYIQVDSEGVPDGNLWGWLLRMAVSRGPR
jgi:hypothetical protein